MSPEIRRQNLIRTGKQMWVLDGERHLAKCSGRDGLLSDLHLTCKLTLHLVPPPRPPQNYVGDKVGRLLPILHTKLIAVSKEANGFALRNYDSWKETGRKRATQRGNSLTASMVFSPQNAAQSLARWGGENALSSGPRKNTSLRCLDSVSCTGYGNLSPLLVLFSSGEFLWSEKKIKMMQDWVLVSSCSTLWEVWKQMALGDYVDCSPKSNNVFRTQAATSATGTFWEAYPLSMKFLLCCMCFQIVHFRI